MWHFELQEGSICIVFCDVIPFSANTVTHHQTDRENDTKIMRSSTTDGTNRQTMAQTSTITSNKHMCNMAVSRRQ